MPEKEIEARVLILVDTIRHKDEVITKLSDTINFLTGVLIEREASLRKYTLRQYAPESDLKVIPQNK